MLKCDAQKNVCEKYKIFDNVYATLVNTLKFVSVYSEINNEYFKDN